MAATPVRDLELPSAPWRFFHTSNLLTYSLVLCGILSALGAQQGHRWQAGAGLAAASLLDLFDGAFAGMFHRTPAQKQFGCQIDSLSDAFAFGAAPVVCCMAYGGKSISPLWVVCSALYLLSTLTRLGYYNLQPDERGGFVGVPTTLMGLLWSAFFCLPFSTSFSAVLLLAGSILMVAPIRIPRPRPPLFFTVAALSLLLAIWHLSRGLFSEAQ